MMTRLISTQPYPRATVLTLGLLIVSMLATACAPSGAGGPAGPGGPRATALPPPGGASGAGGVATAAPAATNAPAETDGMVTGYVYADNDFQLWVNGALVATDPVPVMPHNVVPVSFPAQYPLTLAIQANDTADANTGLEYENTRIGDGGLIARFSNGAATNAQWRCLAVFSGPLDAGCVGAPSTCTVSRKAFGADWMTPGFDDSVWTETQVYAEDVVRPDGDYSQYAWTGAQFIWTGDLQIDNTVLCRLTLSAPPAGGDAGAPSAAVTATPSAGLPAGAFTLSSPAVAEGGDLPRAYTCDGASATLPLAWSGAPAGTQSFAVVMHHVPGPGDTHWYWVLYNVPADVQSLAENVAGIGTLGNNSVNGRTEYAPPCSKGPGAKQYTYTVYALSAAPQLSVPAEQVSRDVLLAALSDRTLASATLNVIYTR